MRVVPMSAPAHGKGIGAEVHPGDCRDTMRAMAAGHGDSGTAARFFYCAKAGAADRAGSKHPTVKPQALMRWLCTLITPPGGRVLDPFAGSGSTLQAALAGGFGATGCEADPGYVLDIHARLRAADPADARIRVETARECKNLKEGIYQLDLEEYLAVVRNGS